ncbi:hypothetical protein ACVIWU_006699 [Bradyrhizobium sp. USDA 4509]
MLLKRLIGNSQAWWVVLAALCQFNFGDVMRHDVLVESKLDLDVMNYQFGSKGNTIAVSFMTRGPGDCASSPIRLASNFGTAPPECLQPAPSSSGTTPGTERRLCDRDQHAFAPARQSSIGAV